MAFDSPHVRRVNHAFGAITITICAAILSTSGLFAACEQKTTTPPPDQTVGATRRVAPTPGGSEAKQPEGSEAKHPEGSEAKQPEGSEAKQPEGSEAKQPEGSEAKQPEGSEAKQPEGSEAKQPPPGAHPVRFIVYEDEDNPSEFVELVEFESECTGIGDIFANDKVIVNPTMYNEREIPLSRVVSLWFNQLGLVGKQIKGVGKIDEPAAYRNCEIVLKNPDRKLDCILVICRDLKGKTVDGKEWSLELRLQAAKDFYKIEIPTYE